MAVPHQYDSYLLFNLAFHDWSASASPGVTTDNTVRLSRNRQRGCLHSTGARVRLRVTEGTWPGMGGAGTACWC